MRILLLRHGITEANEKHLYCGQHRSAALSGGAAPRFGGQEMPAPGTRVYYERHAPLQ